MSDIAPLQSRENFEAQVEKLRKILRNPGYNSLERYWIRISESFTGMKGGQGTVVLGTFVWPEHWRMLDPLPTRHLNPRELHLKRNAPESTVEALDYATSKREEQEVFIGRLRTLTWPMEWKLSDPEFTVAVKKLHWKREDPNAAIKLLKSFVNEVRLRSTLDHPNIALLFGFVENIHNGDAWLVSPWEANGNVREFLQSGEWDIPERISLLHDVANGVEYLHSQDPPICHGDLKSFNVLVSSEYHAVITDLGSARRRPRGQKKETNLSELSPAAQRERVIKKILASWTAAFDADAGEFTLTGPDFSLRWTAPEVLDDGTQDLPSDIWALGWISWEIVTGRIPFDEIDRPGAIISHTIRGKLPAIRENQQLAHVLQLCSIMSDCWIAEPTERIESSAFRKRVGMMPCTAPSGDARNKERTRSATLLLQLGRMHYLQSDSMNAEVHFTQALEIAIRTQDESTQADALEALGRLRYSQSRSNEAEEKLRGAHAIYSRIGDDLRAASVLNDLAGVDLLQSRNSEAEEKLLDAHAIHSRGGNDIGTANALGRLGDSYYAQSRFDEAEKAFGDCHC